MMRAESWSAQPTSEADLQFDITITANDLNAVPELARRAEALGVSGLWTVETAHNPYLPLTLAAQATHRLELGTAIAVAFPRSPMVTAQIAWDLAAQSGGRFILGLGTQVKAHITRRFGVAWDSPGPRMRDYIGALRAIWRGWQAGEALDYRGQFYQHTLMTPFFAPPPLETPDIPIYLAGVGPYMCRLAGELCQGLHVHPFHTPEYLRRQVLPPLLEGVASAGRKREDIALACAVIVATGADAAELEASKAEARRQIAFYASTPSYAGVLELAGYGELAKVLQGHARRGRWDAMVAEVDDTLLELCAVVGTHAELPGLVRARYAGLLDRVAYYMPFEPGKHGALWTASARELRE
jgi:probable F420-dependent oxidoreductase